MKVVLRFDGANGQSSLVTFDEEAKTFASSDGRSGTFARDGKGADLKVDGQVVGRVDVEVELNAVGESSRYTSTEGSGVVTMVEKI